MNPHNAAEQAAVADVCNIAAGYAQTGRRPAGHYRRTLTAVTDVTCRTDLLLAAAVRLAQQRRWYSGEAVAVLVGVGVPPELVYQAARQP
jgi:hypothetical protein